MRTISQLLLAVAALQFLPALHASSPVSEIRAMAPDGLVQIENLAGSIEITGWDRDEVNITGKLGDDAEKLEILESSSGIRILVQNHKNRRNVKESHLRLSIPVSASVTAESVSADISIQGLNGASLVLNSVSGDLLIDAKTERLETESISGDVTFRGSTPRASVETVSGEIDVKGLLGEIRISTVSGDVDLSANQIDRGRFETVSGNLVIDLDVNDGGRLNVQSMSGDVKLTLPTTQEAEFTAQTYSGDIRSDFGKVTRRSHGPGNSFSHREGSNGTAVRIESFSGDITIGRP